MKRLATFEIVSGKKEYIDQLETLQETLFWLSI